MQPRSLVLRCFSYGGAGMEEKKISPQDKWNAKAGEITKMMNAFIAREEIAEEYAEMHRG